MADLQGAYQRGFATEIARQDQVQQEQSAHLLRRKLMLDLIRSGERLAPEDAKFMANLETVTPEEATAGFARVYEKHPDLFPRVVAEYGNVQARKAANENRLQMQDLRDMMAQSQKDYARQLQTPSQEEYRALYGPRYQQYGQEAPAYSGRTYPEIERDLSGIGQAITATKPRPVTGANTPVDPDILAAAGLPEGTTRADFAAAMRLRPPPKAQNEMTENQKIGSMDEIQRYVASTGQVEQDDKGYIKDKDVNALVQEIAARSTEMSGSPTANARTLMARYLKPGLKGKAARAALAELQAASTLTDEEKAARLRKVIQQAKGQ